MQLNYMTTQIGLSRFTFPSVLRVPNGNAQLVFKRSVWGDPADANTLHSATPQSCYASACLSIQEGFMQANCALFYFSI